MYEIDYDDDDKTMKDNLAGNKNKKSRCVKLMNKEC